MSSQEFKISIKKNILEIEHAKATTYFTTCIILLVTIVGIALGTVSFGIYSSEWIPAFIFTESILSFFVYRFYKESRLKYKAIKQIEKEVSRL